MLSAQSEHADSVPLLQVVRERMHTMSIQKVISSGCDALKLLRCMPESDKYFGTTGLAILMYPNRAG